MDVQCWVQLVVQPPSTFISFVGIIVLQYNLYLNHNLEPLNRDNSRLHYNTQGHKHPKPPKNCSHKYSIFAITFFGKIWTTPLRLFLFFKIIFDQLETQSNKKNINPTNNENLECMEYICNKIIHFTKFEKIAHIFQN